MKEFSSANFPISADGRTYHVECNQTDIANRILTVGDINRAKRIQTALHTITSIRESKRGFYFVTGTFNGIPVTIISIGMGFGVIDMMVREVRASTIGTLAIVRFGSCGSLGLIPAGSVSVCSSGGVIVTKNYDYWADQYNSSLFSTQSKPGVSKTVDNTDDEARSGMNPYSISSICPADQELSQMVVKMLKVRLGDETVFEGINASADSFYSSQGRLDSSFGDENELLVDLLKDKVPGVETLEMESSLLLHLAQVCTHQSNITPSGHRGGIRASASAMVFFQRNGTNRNIDPLEIERLEMESGIAILEALTSINID